MTAAKVASAIALLIVSPSAWSQQVFSLGTVISEIANAPGRVNDGLFTDGTFYQDPLGNPANTASSGAVIAAFPSVANDSYVAIANAPADASTVDYPALTFGVGAPQFDGSELIGAWQRVPGTGFTFSNGGGNPFDIFLGRFTTVGGTLQGELSFDTLRIGDAGTFSEPRAERFTLAVGGPAVFPIVVGGPPIDPISFRLRVDSFDSPQGLVNDLYIEAIPTPGAAAVLALAGAVMLRTPQRRHRKANA